jgi:hypothetical protein
MAEFLPNPRLPPVINAIFVLASIMFYFFDETKFSYFGARLFALIKLKFAKFKS